jgi:glycosyltransferase involved in cell wall biosynthesis
MEGTQRLLIVSFFYPPFNSIGAIRVSKMSRYLSELGWDVRVLTTDRDDVPADLAVEIDHTHIVRAHGFDVNALPKRVLGSRRVSSQGYEAPRSLRGLGELYRVITNFPDGQIGWYRAAVRRAEPLIATWRPDVILSSAYPATAHLVARSIARRYRISWVAEYRDPWTDSGSRRRPGPLYPVERWLEDRTVRDAAAIVTVSDSWAGLFRRRFPQIPVHVVPNGFDGSDYPADADPPTTGPLRVLYTGRLYARQDPRPLLEALRSLGADAARTIQMRFVGRYLASVRDSARALGLLGTVVSVDQPVSHDAALRAQREAHALVMFLGDDEDVGWRPAKLYEYLGARRPILMIGGTERHEARVVLRACGAGVAADSASEIAALLRAWSAELATRGAVAYSADPACVAGFERRALAVRLGTALRSVLADQAGTASTTRS